MDKQERKGQEFKHGVYQDNGCIDTKAPKLKVVNHQKHSTIEQECF